MKRLICAGAALGSTTVLACLSLLGGATPALAAETNCSIAPNPVACENALPGDPPSDWQVQGAGDPTIQGYATSMSVNVGQTESFKINTPSTNYHIDILRLGYYGGDGARMIAGRTSSRPRRCPQTQPACLTNSVDRADRLRQLGRVGVVDGPEHRGLRRLHRPSRARRRQDPAATARSRSSCATTRATPTSCVQTSDATWEAYNDYGGNSLYTCTVACPPGEPARLQGAPTRSPTTARSTAPSRPTTAPPTCTTPSTR